MVRANYGLLTSGWVIRIYEIDILISRRERSKEVGVIMHVSLLYKMEVEPLPESERVHVFLFERRHGRQEASTLQSMA
jgi:hypothetical protein